MRIVVLLALLILVPLHLVAEPSKLAPIRVGTSEDFRQLLLASKWSWRNVSAGVPDRECVFMPDGTFRHPHFVARFTITGLNTVELFRKGMGKAVMTFDSSYTKFEALDFDRKRRITGQRISAP